MRKISKEVAEAAAACLNSPEGEMMMSYLIREYGLMERSFIQDAHGKVSPINAAIRDGERGVVGFLFKLKQHETIDK